MGIASMVIGIISLLVGFFPFCGTWAIAPAIIGLVLGIVDTALKSKRGQPKGMSIAGLILNVLAIVVIVVWWVVMIAAAEPIEMDPSSPWNQGGFPQQYQQGPATGMPPGFGQGQPLQQFPSGQPMQPMEPMQPMQPIQPMQPAVPDPAQPQSAPTQ